jgi:ubiquinone/menaquinone biosynthesis C-methylase UbiE
MSEEVYSHGHHASVVRAHARRTAKDSAAYLLPHLRPGLSVLDVGCGPGTITMGLAQLVSSPDGAGRATGLDRSEEVVAEASRLAAEQGVGNVGFTDGNIYDLPYGDGTFDVVHAHQVLHHLVDPVAALREMRRVARPGGIVAVREADYAAMVWHPALPPLDDWMSVYQNIARSNGAEPNAGRHLLDWMLAAGFDPEDLTPTASTWLYATDETRRDHGQSWAERVLESSYADQALERGFATRADLERISAGWRTWTEDPAALFLMPSVEFIARKPEER